MDHREFRFGIDGASLDGDSVRLIAQDGAAQAALRQIRAEAQAHPVRMRAVVFEYLPAEQAPCGAPVAEYRGKSFSCDKPAGHEGLHTCSRFSP